MTMERKIECAEFEDLAVLYALGELDEADRAAVEQHGGDCQACAAILQREMKLLESLSAHREAGDLDNASEFLLAQCRSELSEALDDAEAPRKQSWLERLSPSRWAEAFPRLLAYHPGWATAVLLLIGAVGGITGRAWYRATALPLPGKPLMTVSAAPRMSEQQLETMGVEGIRLEPLDGGTHVELRLRSEQPVLVQGSSDDAEIRRVLTYVIQNGQKFDPAVRLDSLDALRAHTSDPQVRKAFCDAAVNDSDPAVRLKALESLRTFGHDPAARQAMFEALAGDDNSGVRIEAVDGLQAALATPQAAPPDDQSMAILRDRMHNDPNSYVRLHSASVLSQLASFDGARP